MIKFQPSKSPYPTVDWVYMDLMLSGNIPRGAIMHEAYLEVFIRDKSKLSRQYVDFNNVLSTSRSCPLFWRIDSDRTMLISDRRFIVNKLIYPHEKGWFIRDKIPNHLLFCEILAKFDARIGYQRDFFFEIPRPDTVQARDFSPKLINALVFFENWRKILLICGVKEDDLTDYQVEL